MADFSLPEVDEMLSVPDAEVLQYLRERQPSEVPSCSAWWDQVASSLLSCLYDTDAAIDRRASCARLASRVVAGVTSEDRIIGGDASKVRLAHLAAYMSRDPRLRTYLPEVVDVEDLVAEILDSITLEPAQAAQLSEHWQSLPVDEIRQLRRVKNLVRPCMELTSEIRSVSLVNRVTNWSEVSATLP